MWDGQTFSASYFILYPALGILVGMVSWWANEERYQNYILNKKIKARSRT